ncbi:all-trans retinoic acid-induced differentiation factor isoform X3 [Struthio camelus]|uniref:all-trans retinoic acid-induced differentiation factor isoform X3 n=1 Tax=Struthio camelus TaxID=8801 RepID=UPI003603F9A6
MAARLLLLLLLPLLPRAAGTVCGCCPGPLGNGSAVGRYCAGRAGAEPRGRCCLAGGAQPGRIVGLDLSNCSLRSLPPGLPEAAGAIVLDLTENPLATLPNSSFRGFTRLQSLAPAGAAPGSRTRRTAAAGSAGARGTPATAPASWGAFPVLLFGGVLGTVAAALSLLLWSTQRRKAKTP